MHTPVLARDFMTTRLVTLRPRMDVFDAMGLLLKHQISGAPVIDDDGMFLGTFSEKTCMSVVIDAAYEQLPTNEVFAFLDAKVRTIADDCDLFSIAQILLTESCRRLPVLRDGKLVGQISRRDVMRVTLDLIACQPEREAAALLYLSALRERGETPIG